MCVVLLVLTPRLGTIHLSLGFPSGKEKPRGVHRSVSGREWFVFLCSSGSRLLALRLTYCAQLINTLHEWLILRNCGWGDVFSREVLVMSLKTGGPKFELCHPYKSRSWCHVSAIVALGIQIQVALWNALASQPSWPVKPRFSIRPYLKGQSREWLRKTSGIECWPPHVHTYVRVYPYSYGYIHEHLHTKNAKGTYIFGTTGFSQCSPFA